MTSTMVFREDHWSALTAMLSERTELAAVLTSGLAQDDDLTLLCREVIEVPKHSYLEQSLTGLRISSSGYVGGLKAARNDQSAAVFAHTHPGGDPAPSKRDRVVDDQLADVFAERTRTGVYAAFTLGGSPGAPSFSGRVRIGATTTELRRVRVIGNRLRVFSNEPAEDLDAAVFDRQIRAFGRAGQEQLARVHAGIVGVGGTGSAVCEQLIRLGVGRLTVIDSDIIDESNLSRVHESGNEDLGQAKVSLPARLATRIGGSTRVRALSARVTERSAAQALRHCDVIFGCTDDHAGRLVLSRLAYWYLIPVFDMGFLVSTRDNLIDGLFGRVTVVQPGTACLVCRNRVDLERAQAESLPTAERTRRAADGYVPGLDDPAPSVVSFTTAIASMAVGDWMARVLGYGDEPPPSELIFRPDQRSLRTNLVEGRVGHYCTDVSNWGRGDVEPFMGTLWA